MKRTATLLTALAALLMSGCSEKESTGPQNTPTDISSAVIILNNGSMGMNNSYITLHYPEDGSIVTEAFYKANGQRLGDTAQDILCTEDEIFIAVNLSETIFVTDSRLKIKRQINAEDGTERLSPRYLIEADGKIYVTYHEGYLGEIDPKDGYKVRLTRVGTKPEGLAYAQGKIYVANSGAMPLDESSFTYTYDNTVSVVDAGTFSEISRITVNTNPQRVFSNEDGSLVYVSSYGDYASIPDRLQAVNTSTSQVSDLPYSGIAGLQMGADGLLYVLCSGGYDQNWAPLPGCLYRHDAAANISKGILIDDIPAPFSVSLTPDGQIYIGSVPDYVSNGDILVYSPDGELAASFDAGGMNPIKAVSLY